MNHTELKKRMVDRGQTTRVDLALISLANDLKFLREDLNISQEDLARGIGITVQEVHELDDYEKRPTLEILDKVESFLQSKKTNLSDR